MLLLIDEKVVWKAELGSCEAICQFCVEKRLKFFLNGKSDVWVVVFIDQSSVNLF